MLLILKLFSFMLVNRTVYISRVSNARRLASSVQSLDDLLRVAKGEPLEIGNGRAAAESHLSQGTAGRQGTSLKPQ